MVPALQSSFGLGVDSVLTGNMGYSIRGCRPVAVLKNDPMASLSLSDREIPSCADPMMATAPRRLQTLPE